MTYCRMLSLAIVLTLSGSAFADSITHIANCEGAASFASNWETDGDATLTRTAFSDSTIPASSTATLNTGDYYGSAVLPSGNNAYPCNDFSGEQVTVAAADFIRITITQDYYFDTALATGSAESFWSQQAVVQGLDASQAQTGTANYTGFCKAETTAGELTFGRTAPEDIASSGWYKTKIEYEIDSVDGKMYAYGSLHDADGNVLLDREEGATKMSATDVQASESFAVWYNITTGRNTDSSVDLAMDNATYTFEIVPEPATISLVGLGAFVLIRRRRK